jgi:hypothetical protein
MDFLPFRGVENDTSAYLPLDSQAKEIRYIVLEPGAKHSPITCTLGYTSLRRRQHNRGFSYDAISYCWGDVGHTLEIRLRCPKSRHSISTPVFAEQKLNVTKNLHDLLQDFRLQEEPRILWVDAICIRQDDAVEKTHQVNMMGEIYRSATEVLVWLGEADTYSEVVVGAAKMFAQVLPPIFEEERDATYTKNKEHVVSHRFHALWKRVLQDFPEACCADHEMRELVTTVSSVSSEQLGELRRSMQRFMRYSLQDHNYIRVLYAYYHSIDQILSRVWFRRVWVLQEVVLASSTPEGVRKATLHMGDLCIPWNDFVEVTHAAINMAYWLSKEPFEGAKMPQNFQALDSPDSNIFWFTGIWCGATMMRKPDRDPNVEVGISTYLAYTAAFQASDLRDRLFAIVHMAEDTRNVFTKDVRIRPDYNKSIQTIMADYVRWHIEKEKSLKYLAWPDTTIRTGLPPGTPSWVPNIFSEEAYATMTKGSYNPATAAGNTCLCLVAPSSPLVLSIKGFEILSIEHAISPQLEFTNDIEQLTLLVDGGRQEWFAYLKSQCQSHLPADTNDLDLYNNLLSMFNEPVDDRAIRYAEHIKLGDGKYDLWSCFDIPEPEIDPNDEHYNRVSIHLGIETFLGGFWKCRNRGLYLTSDGSIALCSASVKAGDIVVVFLGGNVPFVLRPVLNGKTADDEEQFEFLGAVSFYGDKWMTGDALAYQQDNEVSTRFFELI